MMSTSTNLDYHQRLHSLNATSLHRAHDSTQGLIHPSGHCPHDKLLFFSTSVTKSCVLVSDDGGSLMMAHFSQTRIVRKVDGSFFLPLGRDARWPRLANQVGVRQAVPKEGCLVAQSAAECCCCLRSTDKRPTQLSRLHAGLRLQLPEPSSTCRFRHFSIAAGLFLPACAKCL